MDYRQGVCSSCQNSFRVPATFVQNKAKCPKCGGVVEIGPVQSGGTSSAPATSAPAAAPAAPPPPAKAPPPPAKVPSPAPVASKPAAPAKPAAAPTPAPKSVSSPSAAKPAASASARSSAPASPKPAAAVAAKPSVRASAESAAAKVKAGGAKPASRATLEEDEQDAGEARESGKRRRGAHAKQKSFGPLLASMAALLALIGAGAWYFMVKRPADIAAAEAAADAARALKAASAPSGPGAVAQKPSEAPPSETRASDSSAPAPGDAAPDKPKEAKPAAKAEVVDDIDLRELPELGKFKDSTEEQWTEIVGLATTFTDLSAGARGNRAGLKLEELGRAAMPALLNQFRTLNLSNEDDFRRGDMIQKRLEKICKGRNFGWSYDGDLAAVVYNKKAVKAWFKIWDTVGEDDAQWLGFTKQTAPAPSGDAPKPAEGGGGLDDF